jgi:hypothetical protein
MPRRLFARTVNAVRAFLVAAVVVALAAAPAAMTLTAAPDAPRRAAPVGTDEWRADPEHLPDPMTSDPATVYHFFTAPATPAPAVGACACGTGDALAARYPGVVGNLDGAPVSLRYAANRRAMAADGPAHDGQYLAFDPRGDGTVVRVYGDLTTADRVAVLVPGAGNRLGNFWTGAGNKLFRSPSVQGVDLYAAMSRIDGAVRVAGGTRFAVVVWLGYDAPNANDVTAAREDLARDGAEALERFVAGLTTLRPQATITLLGYSYGSTVVGLAAHRLPAQVTDIVSVGSPGMGVDNVAGLHTTARVWAGLSRHDPMRFVPGVRLFGLGHGTQPADPSFGARIIRTADVPDHDHYLFPGTDSQDDLAHIALLGALPGAGAQ